MQGAIRLPVSPIHLIEQTDAEMEDVRKLLEPILGRK